MGKWGNWPPLVELHWEFEHGVIAQVVMCFWQFENLPLPKTDQNVGFPVSPLSKVQAQKII